MNQKRILINAAMSVTQIAVVSVTLFILYKFLLSAVGTESLGIWSLILATTSVTQIANLGLSGSVVKFVAKYVARKEDKKASEVIQTAAITLAIGFGIVLLIGYPLIKWVLSLAVPADSVGIALPILPFALFSLWLSIITGVFQSGIDGFQKIYIRNILMMGASLLFTILCFLFAPKYGLIGLAYAQIINNSIIFLLSWILIKQFIPILPIIPYQWDRMMFKEIMSYGINFQIASVATMFYDPVTKALLSKFGGLSAVGYYEMANKMVQQIRAFIVSANQVLVPSIAELNENSPEQIKSVYLTSYKLLFFLSLPLFTLLIVFIPIVSKLWIGNYEQTFILYAYPLAIGYLLNIFTGPAYFTNLGTGVLRYNVIGHLVIGFLNAILGFLLGLFYGGSGVVIGWAISLSIGSSIIYIAFHITEGIALSELFPPENKNLFLSSFLFFAVSFVLQHRFLSTIDTVPSTGILAVLFVMINIVPLWSHPMRKRLKVWVLRELFNR
ncbi:MAG: oligosaccharide flippase family protein [Victivallales bacterium]|nr:oligosaccharide flippase family protein [Victivallales bacterium]